MSVPPVAIAEWAACNCDGFLITMVVMQVWVAPSHILGFSFQPYVCTGLCLHNTPRHHRVNESMGSAFLYLGSRVSAIMHVPLSAGTTIELLAYDCTVTCMALFAIWGLKSIGGISPHVRFKC